MIIPRNTQWILFGILTILLLLSFFLYFLFLTQNNNTSSPFSLSTKDALDSLSSEDYISAAQKTEATLSNAKTPEEKRSAEFLHARSLLGRNQPGDLVMSVSLFKGVALDESTEPQRRAGAMVSLATVYYHDTSGETIRNNVFNTTPFSSYLEAAGGDVTMATLALLDQANTIYPTYFAYADTAKISRLRILQLGLKTNPETQLLAEKIVAAAEKTKDLVGQATAISEQNLTANQITIAIALDIAHRIDPQLVASEVVTDEYEKALSMLNETAEDNIRYVQVATQFAAHLEATNPQSPHINDLLIKIMDLSTRDSSAKAVFVSQSNSLSFSDQLPGLVLKNPDFARFVADSQ